MEYYKAYECESIGGVYWEMDTDEGYFVLESFEEVLRKASTDKKNVLCHTLSAYQKRIDNEEKGNN
jgi:hypothetical protein